MPQEGKIYKHISKRHLHRRATEQTERDLQLLIMEHSNARNISGQWVDDTENDNFQDSEDISGYRYSDNENDDECTYNDIEMSRQPLHYHNFNTDNEKCEEAESSVAWRSKQFKLKITNWAKTFKIHYNALNALLKILCDYTDVNFPHDSRTLLGTPKKTCISNMGNGYYHHIGFAKVVHQIIIKRLNLNHTFNDVDVLINIDGAPIGLSTEKALWPILCMDDKLRRVKVIGIYYGSSKPSNANDYLSPFIDEAVQLIHNGYNLQDKVYNINIKAFVCDSPAKAFILNVKYHSGYHSCSKCTIEGSYIENRVCFPTNTSRPLREDTKFRNLQYEDYQNGNTILTQIPNFNIISNVVLDSMHLVYLGVTKRLIMLWMSKGPFTIRLSNLQKNKISTQLEDILNILPNDFVKRSRSLTHWHKWKATEFRHFLLYSGPVILKDIVAVNVYDHFIMLHAAITILNDPILIKEEKNLESAHCLLRSFVIQFSNIYGPENVTFNVHNLTHLCDEVRFFKTTLDSLSSFPFESYICTIKNMLRKGETPLQQIARRIEERSDINFETQSLQDSISIKLEKCKSNMITKTYNAEFQVLKTPIYSLNCTDKKNDCVILRDGTVITITGFAISNSEIVAIGRKLKFQQVLYDKPLSSNLLDITIVKDNNYPVRTWNCNAIYKKIFKIPYKNCIVALPVLHTYNNV